MLSHPRLKRRPSQNRTAALGRCPRQQPHTLNGLLPSLFSQAAQHPPSKCLLKPKVRAELSHPLHEMPGSPSLRCSPATRRCQGLLKVAGRRQNGHPILHHSSLSNGQSGEHISSEGYIPFLFLPRFRTTLNVSVDFILATLIQPLAGFLYTSLQSLSNLHPF